MSKINSPNISAQPLLGLSTTMNVITWNQQSTHYKESEHCQLSLLLKYHLLILFYFMQVVMIAWPLNFPLTSK